MLKTDTLDEAYILLILLVIAVAWREKVKTG